MDKKNAGKVTKLTPEELAKIRAGAKVSLRTLVLRICEKLEVDTE